ncbi:MAG: hypothetical protein LLH30_19430 [Candidatus Manganitrophus sp. SA1]|nr:hypothetical protein [Candidatus Manganitrophus morganii]
MPNGGEMMCPSMILIDAVWIVLLILLIAGMIWAIRLAKRKGPFLGKRDRPIGPSPF